MTEAAAGDARLGAAADNCVTIMAAAAAAIDEVCAEMCTGVAVGFGLLMILFIDTIAVLSAIVAASESSAGGKKQEAGWDLAGAAHRRTYDRAQHCFAQEKNGNAA